jgi:hypothetical protein
MGYTYSKGAYRVEGSMRIFDHAFGGTYTVNGDCTIGLLFTRVPDPLNLPLPITGMLADGGKEVRLVAAGPGAIAPATLHKITMVGCSTADFAGSFALDMEGRLVEPTDRAGPFGRVGRLVSNGQGTFTASTLANYSGSLTVETFIGTYSVDTECKMLFRYGVTETLVRFPIPLPDIPGATIAGPPYNGVMEGILYNRSNAILMQISPLGGGVTGSLKK